MVDLALLQSVSYIAGALGVCVAAAYYVMNLRISQKNQELSLKAQETSIKTQELALKSQQQNLETRQAQLLMQVVSQMDEKWVNSWFEIFSVKLTSYEDFEKMNMDRKLSSMYNPMIILFEGLGVLVHRKLLDIELIDDMLSSFVIMFWERFGRFEVESRVRNNHPQSAEWTEYLYNEVLRIASAEHPEILDKKITPMSYGGKP